MLEEHASNIELGPPYSALYGPCQRCWIYEKIDESNYCFICKKILDHVEDVREIIRDCVVILGFFKHSPWENSPMPIIPNSPLGFHQIDHQHFIIMTYKTDVKCWLQDLVLSYGTDLHGFIQLFPTMGQGQRTGMGDILSRAAHQENVYLQDKLWVRFFPQAWQVMNSKKRDEMGILTFPCHAFIDFIEAATVFKDIVPVYHRKDMHKLLTTKELRAPFYWGRFLRTLDQKSRDLIDSWEINHWPLPKIDILYELTAYVSTTTHH